MFYLNAFTDNELVAVFANKVRLLQMLLFATSSILQTFSGVSCFKVESNFVLIESILVVTESKLGKHLIEINQVVVLRTIILIRISCSMTAHSQYLMWANKNFSRDNPTDLINLCSCSESFLPSDLLLEDLIFIFLNTNIYGINK